MYGAGDTVGEFVEWSEETEELGKTWCNGDGKHCIPNKKSDDGMFGDSTFFPGNSRMSKVGNNGSDGGGDKIRKPDEIVIFDDEIG